MNEQKYQELSHRFQRDERINWREFAKAWRYANNEGSRELSKAMNAAYNIVANVGGNDRFTGDVWPLESRNVPRINRLLRAAANIARTQGIS